MKNAIQFKRNILFGSLCLIVIISSAWQLPRKINTAENAGSRAQYDTSQPRTGMDSDEFRMKIMDKSMEELNLKMADLNVKMQGLNEQINKQLKEALANIDYARIEKETQQAINNIDWQKVKAQTEQALQLAKQEIENIDVQKIQADVLKAQKEVQRKYIESGKMQQEVQRAMEQAKKSMEKANAELNEMKEFTGKLQEDGLIDKKKGYKIEWKDGGNLYINGELQPKEISEKYKKYYKKDGTKIICNGENTDLF